MPIITFIGAGSSIIFQSLPGEILSSTLPVRRSNEHGSLMIHSIETGSPCVVYGNLPNYGLIDNLPQDDVVEVPCLVNKDGLQPQKIVSLTPKLMTLI
jgi:alpha-galactosidase